MWYNGSEMKKYAFAILCILLAVWFLYGQTGGYEYLRLDDPDYTFRCAFVKDGLSPASLAEAFTNARHGGIWMPLTYLSYMCDISLFGAGPAPHHFVNTTLHSLNAILLFLLLLICCKRAEGTPVLAATLAVLFWAIHPQRAEAVAWIASRKELLCAFFTLLGLLAWRLRLDRTGAARLGWTLSATLACACACMSKPTAMCFPFLALAIDTLAAPTPQPASRVRRVLPYLPQLLLAGFTGALALFSQTHPEGHLTHELFTGSFLWRILNALVAVGLDAFQLLIPFNLHLDYRAVPGHFPLQGTLGLITCVLLLLALATLFVRLRSRRRLLALLLFFFAALVPTLGIFGSFGEHARADRFLYLPMMAVSLALCSACAPFTRKRLLACGIPVVLVYLVASFPVVAAYENNYTVFSRTIACDPENGRALRHVADEECARNQRLDKGIELYRKSQSLQPRDATAAQLAYALMRRGSSSDFAEIRRLCAVFACDHARDRRGLALEALGTTALRERKWKEAHACLTDAIQAQRRFYGSDYYSEYAFLALGVCSCNMNRTDDAIRIFEPLTRSSSPDIRGKAVQYLTTLRQNPHSILFF